MTISRRPIYLALVLIALILPLSLHLPATSAAETKEELIKRGDLFFKVRGANNIKDKAVPGNILNSIDAYMAAYEAGEPSAELIIKIMRSTYFYVTYAEEDRGKQKEAVTKALEIGEAGLELYPESAGINYWMAALWGRWSKAYGKIASAREDVVLKIKAYAERTIELDPAYAEGGGYRTLGRLHYKTPRIPFIISWPRKELALAYLEKALKEGPENLTNHLFYAESLIERGRRDEARKEVGFVQAAKYRYEENIVEVLRAQRNTAELIAILNDRVDIERINRVDMNK
ncbi:MAG: tetratricopeptide repeat protein [Thermodesulfobacteriota bacterium]